MGEPEKGVPENVEISQDGDILTMRIDMTQRLRRTKGGTGPSRIIGTTNGFYKLGTGEWINLQVGVKE